MQFLVSVLTFWSCICLTYMSFSKGNKECCYDRWFNKKQMAGTFRDLAAQNFHQEVIWSKTKSRFQGFQRLVFFGWKAMTSHVMFTLFGLRMQCDLVSCCRSECHYPARGWGSTNYYWETMVSDSWGMRGFQRALIFPVAGALNGQNICMFY